MDHSKYKENYIIILFITVILLTYYYVNQNKELERFWVKESLPVYNIINYTKLILTLTLVFNIKVILFDIIMMFF